MDDLFSEGADVDGDADLEDRDQLPASYAFADWWEQTVPEKGETMGVPVDPEAMLESEQTAPEHELAREHMIPWSFREPHHAPTAKHETWRGMFWLLNAQKWMTEVGIAG